MIKVIQRRLIIPQGDTGIFTIPVLPSVQPGNAAVFTIFKDASYTSKIYEKVMTQIQDVLTINFRHEDTVNFPIGKYYWDVKIYNNPEFNEKQELIGGSEINSYYAAYKLPRCEVRPS